MTPTPPDDAPSTDDARASTPDIALQVARTRAEQALFGAAAAVRVGRYLLMEQIGAGGMAEVYAAYDPQLDRKVALKLLHSRGADRSHARRLVREAQTLAQLSHPNVVAVHDAGALEDGTTVFIAMELVRGTTLTGWLAERTRSWREVLRVAVAAGRGLAAAHAAGIVHRDFKPDNVMIEDDAQRSLAVVRVVDFGLSRAHPADTDTIDTIDSEGDDAITRSGAVLGTPAYMALEQHEARTVDARADQFGFCVTLWESLHGARPYSGATRLALARSIADGQINAPLPGRAAPAWIVRALTRGLAADPDTRWPDMNALLAALEDDPTRRRRRAWLLAGTLAALALPPAAWFGFAWWQRSQCDAEASAVASVWSDDARMRVRDGLEHSGAHYWATTWERLEPTLDDYTSRWATGRARACMDDAIADRAAQCFDERLDAVSALLGALEQADERAVANAIKVAQRLPALDPCEDARWLSGRPQPDPALRERIEAARAELTRIRGLSAFGRYEEGATAAAALREQAEEIGWEPLVAEVWYASGDMDESRGQHESAEAAYGRGLELALAVGDEDLAARILPQMIFTIGASRGQHERALGLATVARSLVARLEPTPGLRTADLANALGNVERLRGEREAALASFQQALALRSAALPEDHADVIAALNNVSVAQYDVGDFEASIATGTRALALKEQAAGTQHPDVVLFLLNLSAGHSTAGHIAEAEAMADRAEGIAREVFGPRHALIADTLIQKALLRIDRRDIDDATMADLALALSIREEQLGPDAPLVSDALQVIGHAHHARAELGPAAAAFERALAIQRARFGDEHIEVAQTKFHLASIAVSGRRYADALPLLESSLATRRAVFPDNHEGIGACLEWLGLVRDAMGEHGEARALFNEAIGTFARAHGPDHPTIAQALVYLARAETADGDPRSALATLARAEAMVVRAFDDRHPQIADIALARADASLALGDAKDACEAAERAVDLRRVVEGQAGLDEAEFVLARARWQCGGDRREARTLAEKACEGAPDVGRTRRDDCKAWLAAHR